MLSFDQMENGEDDTQLVPPFRVFTLILISKERNLELIIKGKEKKGGE